MRTKVMLLGICGVVAVLHVPASAQEPSFRGGLGSPSSVSDFAASYRFRPLGASERRRSAAGAAGEQRVPVSSGNALSYGWRFRPLRSETKVTSEVERPPMAAVYEPPRQQPSPRFSADFYSSFTHLDAVPAAPYAEWRPAIQPPPDQPTRATTPAPAGSTHANPAVYVMFRGKRYRFRGPSARVRHLPDPSSSYLGEESLFAAQPADRTWARRRGDTSPLSGDVMVTPFATILN